MDNGIFPASTITSREESFSKFATSLKRRKDTVVCWEPVCWCIVLSVITEDNISDCATNYRPHGNHIITGLQIWHHLTSHGLQRTLVNTNQKYRPAASEPIIRLLPLFSLVILLSLILTPSDKLTPETERRLTTQLQARSDRKYSQLMCQPSRYCIPSCILDVRYWYTNISKAGLRLHLYWCQLARQSCQIFT